MCEDFCYFGVICSKEVPLIYEYSPIVDLIKLNVLAI